MRPVLPLADRGAGLVGSRIMGRGRFGVVGVALLTSGCASANEYQWLIGLVAGLLASSIGQALNHVFVVRRERAAEAKAILRARLENGRKALDQYLNYFEEPPIGQDRYGNSEAEHFEERLADLFGAEFAAEAAYDSFRPNERREAIERRIEKMRQQIANWEAELGYPPRKELGA
jgi:hypothetical protein